MGGRPPSPTGPSGAVPPRYRFGEFVLSARRRQLLRAGREVALIPRYFDLLVLLVERRADAVHRRDILDRVWSDVVVSDGAVSQAVRTLRRALADDPREPRYIRTVSRHGYRFVHPDVVEEPDEGPSPPPASAPPPAPSPPGDERRFEAALARLLSGAADTAGEGDERREAAETLHALGTAEALRRLERRPGHERARALLRDTRFDVPGAGPVPLLGQPGAMRAIAWLAALRLRRALGVTGRRWGSACAGGVLAGAVAGALGGLALWLAPGSDVPLRLIAVLSFAGAAAGGIGAAGVGAGLAAAEALVRTKRAAALVVFGAAGGAIVGGLAELIMRWTLEGVFGQGLADVGGAPEGLALGAAAGLGYALATPRASGGLAAPRGRERLRAALATGFCCALAALALTGAGSNLAGASLNLVARGFQGSQVRLSPLARLLGEAELGPMTRAVLAAYEGLFFGAGLALGLTRRA